MTQADLLELPMTAELGPVKFFFRTLESCDQLFVAILAVNICTFSSNLM